jgi:hypothetical protein
MPISLARTRCSGSATANSSVPFNPFVNMSPQQADAFMQNFQQGFELGV